VARLGSPAHQQRVRSRYTYAAMEDDGIIISLSSSWPNAEVRSATHLQVGIKIWIFFVYTPSSLGRS